MEMATSIIRTKTNFSTSVAMAAMAMPFWAGMSFAQEAQDDGAQSQSADQAQQTEQSGGTLQAADGQQGRGSNPDALIATVGDAEEQSEGDE